jgi:restriction system protein
MKFKMSEKSLFAFLLRSPWWVSLLLVLVFALAARALLPAEYAAMGALGAFPFLVIAIMAAWRQWRAPSPALLAAALERAAGMSWRDFSALLEQTLQGQGYSVTRLNGDAADFRLERQGRVSLLSCRRWKAASHGIDALRQLEAARQAQEAQQAIYISLGPVSDAARLHAQGAGIRLIHGADLALLMLGEAGA